MMFCLFVDCEWVDVFLFVDVKLLMGYCVRDVDVAS